MIRHEVENDFQTESVGLGYEMVEIRIVAEFGIDGGVVANGIVGAEASLALLLTYFINRHKPHNVHTEFLETGQLLCGSLKVAFRSVLAHVHFIYYAVIGPGCVRTLFTAGRKQCQRKKKRGCSYSQFCILPFHLQY